MKTEKRFAKAYLEITNVCNLSCDFCKGTRRKKSFMTCKEFEILSEKLRPFTDFLYLHVVGEPLLHPHFSELLDIAQRLCFKVIIVTNGTLLSEKGQAILDHTCVFKVSVSLHSFEANSNPDFDGYLTSCLDFCGRASEKGIISVFRLWNLDSEKRYGKISANADTEKRIHEFFPDGEWADNTKGIRIREKLFVEYGERFEWREDFDNKEKIFCYALRDQIAVLCDGTVVPCCIDSDADLALGNLFTDDLKLILNSGKALSISEGFAAGNAAFDFCKKCGFARTRL